VRDINTLFIANNIVHTTRYTDWRISRIVPPEYRVDNNHLPHKYCNQWS